MQAKLASAASTAQHFVEDSVDTRSFRNPLSQSSQTFSRSNKEEARDDEEMEEMEDETNREEAHGNAKGKGKRLSSSSKSKLCCDAIEAELEQEDVLGTDALLYDNIEALAAVLGAPSHNDQNLKDILQFTAASSVSASASSPSLTTKAAPIDKSKSQEKTSTSTSTSTPSHWHLERMAVTETTLTSSQRRQDAYRHEEAKHTFDDVLGNIEEDIEDTRACKQNSKNKREALTQSLKDEVEQWKQEIDAAESALMHLRESNRLHEQANREEKQPSS